MPVHILNDTPLALGFIAGRVRKTGVHLTTIVKGAFKLLPGLPAEVGERPLLSGDLHWDDDREKSCMYSSDFAPFKPKADVLISGTCHQPGGRAKGSARVTARVGSMRKALAIFGDRHFVEQKLGGHGISDPIPFRSMPLRWERAFGGAGFAANPVGKGWAPASGPQSRPLPNVELAGAPIRFPGDQPEPAGLGPIDARWQQRTTHVGTYGTAWLAERWPDLPLDFDWRYFNAAPEDQQVAELRGDEPIAIEGMHPELARFDAHLPGLRPRCFLRKTQTGDAPPEEVLLRLDTVIMDMDAATLVLVWRGLSPVWSRDHAEVEKALLVVESMVDSPRDASAYDTPAYWNPAHEQERLAVEEEAAARAAAEPPAPPPPATAGKEIDEDDAAERAGLEEARADLAKAGADPALLERLKGVTKAAVFTAILTEELEKDAPKEPEAQPEKGAEAKKKEDEKKTPQQIELDGMRADLEKAGADPALLAKLAAATTVPRFLEILLGEMPPGNTPAEKQERSDLIESIRKVDADTQAAALTEEGQRRAARGDRLTRAEVTAMVASGASLAEANLTELDLSRMALRGVNLSAAKLDGAKLGSADLTSADLTGASLRLAELDRVILVEAVLEGADLEGALLPGADLTRAQLAGINMANTRAEGAILDEADVSGGRLALADLKKASLKGAILDGADLHGANLTGARAAGAKLRGVNLADADLSAADLDGAILIGCAMDRARLFGASLRAAHLDGATGEATSFQGAVLVDARAPGARFTGASFVNADARGSTWTGADLTGCDFEAASLGSAIFADAVLATTSFALARLEEADLSRAKLMGAKMTRTNLFRARLGGADLTDADCRASNLFECDLFEAVATRTRFERANLKRTCLDRSAS